MMLARPSPSRLIRHWSRRRERKRHATDRHASSGRTACRWTKPASELGDRAILGDALRDASVSLLCRPPAEETDAMTQPWEYDAQRLDAQWAHSEMPLPTQPSVDEDLFSAALLFLDHHDDAHSSHSDSDGYGDVPMATNQLLPVPLDWEATQYAQPQPMHVDAKFSPSAVESLFDSTEVMPGTLETCKPDFLMDAAPAPVPIIYAPVVTAPRRVNKRREEIERLRIESQQLETRLAVLQERPLKSSTEVLSPQEVNPSFLGEAWHEVAANQLAQRQHAEEENRRLKELINEQKRVARALRRLVTKHANAKGWDALRPPVPLPPALKAQTSTAIDDPSVFDTLLTSLVGMYAQADSVFSSSRASSSPSFRDVQTDIQGTDRIVVQNLDSRIVPFAAAATADAVWQQLFTAADIKAFHWEHVGDKTYRAQVSAFTEMGEFSGHAQAKMVMRRVDEADRVIILRSGLYKCLQAVSDNQFLKQPMRHYHWIMITKPLNDSIGQGRESVCQVLTCDVCLPKLDGADEMTEHERERELASLMQTCADMSSHHLDVAREQVDSILLQRRRSSSSDPSMRFTIREIPA